MSEMIITCWRCGGTEFVAENNGRICTKCNAYSEISIVTCTPVHEEPQTDTTSLLDMFFDTNEPNEQ
jgi:hypothetical protein